METLNSPSVPISWGELLDKISILEIKAERMSCPHQRANVEKEHRLLLDRAAPVMTGESISPLFQRLKRINATLWDIEDAIRQEEEAVHFGPAFVALARSVYLTNDERASVKRAINELLASDLVEEKSYRAGGLGEPAH